MKKSRGRKVFVGLSGGVDSAVSAYLLQQQGYDVHGVFIQTWTPEWMECGWRDDRRDAMRVAIRLGIPYHDLDLSREYREGVADYMIAEYRAGRTPNPDVMCNREVKFGGFLRYALSCGADYIATGHYAQNINNQLCKGVDPLKDQSYFLWTLTKEQLMHVLFPVGGLPKSETRKIADRAKLPVATKKDSQGICFLGAVDMEEFLSHYIEHKEGDVFNMKGNKIGIHTGVWFVTLGQRFAGGITNPEYRGKVLFVVGKDVDSNSIVVSTEQSPDRRAGSEHATHTAGTGGNVSLLSCVIRDDDFRVGANYTAQIRYHGEQLGCTVVGYDTDRMLIDWHSPPVLVASGQSVAMYSGDVCIGGGIVV